MTSSSPANAVQRARPLPVRKKLCYSCIVMCLFVAGLELSCRTLSIGGQRRVTHYIANWEKQWQDDFYVMRPNLEFGINSDGLRDYEHRRQNSPPRLRIVCLGDSVTAGYGLRRESSYPSLLEQQLQMAGRDAEVFNVALPGWSIRQQRIAYERIARKYEPDCVIVGVCLNDIPEMQNNISQSSATMLWLYRHSYLVRGLLQPELREISRVEELFEEADAPHIRRAWMIYRQEFLQLANGVREDGARLVLLVFPFRFQLRSDAPQPVAQQLLADLAASCGAEFVDVLEDLRPHRSKAFLDYDHLTREGGELVAKRLIDDGVLDIHPGESR